MPATLCVHVFSSMIEESHDLKFFESEHWTAESEKELLVKLQDLLSLSRTCAESFEIKIDIEVKDMNNALFLFKKKINNNIEINHQKLSLREIEVLSLIMQGFTNHEIAEKLFISYETVRSHRKNILSKTHAKNTAALINHYHQTFFER
jgi:DNA-binding NarL/FixJ family response regulator